MSLCRGPFQKSRVWILSEVLQKGPLRRDFGRFRSTAQGSGGLSIHTPESRGGAWSSGLQCSGTALWTSGGIGGAVALRSVSLAGWLAGWQAGRLVGRQAGRQAGWLAGWLVGWQAAHTHEATVMVRATSIKRPLCAQASRLLRRHFLIMQRCTLLLPISEGNLACLMGGVRLLQASA